MIAPTGPLAAHGAAAALALHDPRARATGAPPATDRRRAADRPSRVSLADALRICLADLEAAPERFETAAVVWHARWCTHAPGMTLADAISGLGAVQALAGPGALPAARALQSLSERHGLDEVAAVLAAWIADRHPGGRGPRPTRREQGPA